MEQRDNDNRSYEEIRAGWEKNGLVFGKLMSKSEQREAQKKISEDARKRESKRTKKEMRRNISKPVALVSLAGFFSKILHIIVTLYAMAMVVNIFFIWQIYKAVLAAGWLAIFKTEYSLYSIRHSTSVPSSKTTINRPSP